MIFQKVSSSIGTKQACPLFQLKIGHWKKEGARTVPIAHNDDKRQLTAVLAITAAGDYLPPQLLYQGKHLSVTHRLHFQLVGMYGTLTTTGPMKLR